MCVSVWVPPTEDSPSKEMRRYGGCPPAEAAPLSPRFEVQPGHPLPALRGMGKAAQEPHLGCPLASAFIHVASQQCSGTFSSQHPGENKAQSKLPLEKNHQGGGMLALEIRPLSKYNTARLPAALSRWPLRWLSTSGSAWPCLRFEVMFHEKHASWLQTLMREMLPA